MTNFGLIQSPPAPQLNDTIDQLTTCSEVMHLLLDLQMCRHRLLSHSVIISTSKDSRPMDCGHWLYLCAVIWNVNDACAGVTFFFPKSKFCPETVLGGLHTKLPWWITHTPSLDGLHIKLPWMDYTQSFLDGLHTKLPWMDYTQSFLGGFHTNLPWLDYT